jgi:hypothetical protein
LGQVKRRADADVERTVGISRDNRNEEWRQVERRTNLVKGFRGDRKEKGGERRKGGRGQEYQEIK